MKLHTRPSTVEWLRNHVEETERKPDRSYKGQHEPDIRHQAFRMTGQERRSSINLAPGQAKYTDRNPLVQFANRRFFETTSSLVRSLDVRSTLDAGCGEGVMLHHIARDHGLSSLGLDLDRLRLLLARERLPASLLTAGNVQSMPFQESAFDLVLMLEVLEHVGNPTLALDEAYRITRRYFIGSVPNEPWWRVGNMLRLKYLRQWGNTPEHINHWRSPAFQSFVRTRFAILEVRHPFLWTFVLAEKRH